MVTLSGLIDMYEMNLSAGSTDCAYSAVQTSSSVAPGRIDAKAKAGVVNSQQVLGSGIKRMCRRQKFQKTLVDG